MTHLLLLVLLVTLIILALETEYKEQAINVVANEHQLKEFTADNIQKYQRLSDLQIMEQLEPFCYSEDSYYYKTQGQNLREFIDGDLFDRFFSFSNFKLSMILNVEQEVYVKELHKYIINIIKHKKYDIEDLNMEEIDPTIIEIAALNTEIMMKNYHEEIEKIIRNAQLQVREINELLKEENELLIDINLDALSIEFNDDVYEFNGKQLNDLYIAPISKYYRLFITDSSHITKYDDDVVSEEKIYDMELWNRLSVVYPVSVISAILNIFPDIDKESLWDYYHPIKLPLITIY